MPVVQLWTTVMFQLYNYGQLWCASCTPLTFLILLGTRNKLVIQKENVTSKMVRLMKINLEGWITLRTNCKKLKICNLMGFFWKCFKLTNNTDDNSNYRDLPAAMLFDLKMLFSALNNKLMLFLIRLIIARCIIY